MRVCGQGKSAKKNRLSGFVPFSQISNNDHKKMIEPSPRKARTEIYFRNVMARQQAEAALNQCMNEHELDVDDRKIYYISVRPERHPPPARHPQLLAIRTRAPSRPPAHRWASLAPWSHRNSSRRHLGSTCPKA